MERKSRKYKPRPSKTERQINADLEEEKRKARPVRPLDDEKARERTLQRAVKLLAAKPRSIQELRERLLEKQWTDEAAADYALAKLKEYGYLDDERFAFGFASYRVRQKPVGRQRLARDLQTKKVSKETADAALELVYQETPEEELITRAIEKRIRLRGRPTTRQETKSLYDHLLRLGFSYDLIIRKVREASDAPDEDEDA
ncbi:MAG: regulatory protein [Acidobacteriota bacterium]|nr:regulatory protein [Acidobacteriota bacterium]